MGKTKYAYGIDFGTSNSTVTAVSKNGEPIRLELDQFSFDPAVTRSVLYVDHNSSFTFGQEAVNKYLKDIAEGRVTQRKQIFTGKYLTISSPADWNGFVPDQIVPELLEVEEGEGGRLLQSLKSALASPYVQEFYIFDKKYSVEDLISIYLKNLKERADKILNVDVTDVVLGRPVNYVGSDNEIAIKRMTKAAKNAGFQNIEFEYEPVGAAYDYGISVKEKNIALMFDFGGGTLDITIMEFPSKKVLANTGIGLGGDYLNSEIFLKKISKHFGSESLFGEKQLRVPKSVYEGLKNWYAISLMKTQTFDNTIDTIGYKNSQPEKIEALRSLIYNNLGFTIYEEIDRVKKSLSANLQETITMKGEKINILEMFTRNEFEEIIHLELSKIEKVIDEALALAGLIANQIDNIATTGGSSLIPVVRKVLEDKFSRGKLKESDAFTSVSTGLGLRACELYFKSSSALSPTYTSL